MNDLLKKLIELDKKAQTIDDEIKQEKDNLETQIQQEIEAIKAKHMVSAQETVEKETEIIRSEAETKWNDNCKKYDSSRLELENQFNENFDKWVETIVADVLA